MPNLNLDDMGDPDDDGWRFDPANPPEEFTREMLGRLTIGQLKQLRDRDNGILSESQQASFDAAYAEWSAEIAQKFKPLADAVKIKVAPQFSEAMAKIQRDLAGQLDVSRALGVRVTRPEADWFSGIEPIRPRTVPISTTAAEFESRVEDTQEHLMVLRTIADVLKGQSQAAARGAFFYLVVGIATTLAGVAALVSMDSWCDRLWTLGITAGIAALALLIYVVVRWRQGRTD